MSRLTRAIGRLCMALCVALPIGVVAAAGPAAAQDEPDLIFKKSTKHPEFSFGDCDSTNDDHLFRFSPKGDLVAVASGEKKPYCLSAKGVDRGAKLFLGKCNGKPQQKWTLDGKQLMMASGECAAYNTKKKRLELHDCSDSDTSQQWETTPIADLQKLSETPAEQLYTVSLRDVETGNCVDVADKIGLSYECDGSDYQTFNLNSDSQLRVLQDCVRAQHTRKGSGEYRGGSSLRQGPGPADARCP